MEIQWLLLFEFNAKFTKVFIVYNIVLVLFFIKGSTPHSIYSKSYLHLKTTNSYLEKTDWFLCWKRENRKKTEENTLYQIQTVIESTFSVLHVFLLVFHVLVMAPSRRWIGFFDAAADDADALSFTGDARFSIVVDPTTVDWRLFASAPRIEQMN